MIEKNVLPESQKNGIDFDNPDKVLSNMLTKLRIERLQQKLISDTPNNSVVFENWIKGLTQDERKFLAKILLSQKSELEKPEEAIKGKENAEKKLTDKELAKKENDSMEVKILVNVRKFGEDIFS